METKVIKVVHLELAARHFFKLGEVAGVAAVQGTEVARDGELAVDFGEFGGEVGFEKVPGVFHVDAAEAWKGRGASAASVAREKVGKEAVGTRC